MTVFMIKDQMIKNDLNVQRRKDLTDFFASCFKIKHVLVDR